MKKSFAAAALLLALPTLQAAEDKTLESPAQQAGYTIGLQIGQNLKRDNIQIDADALALGIKDVQAGRDPRLNEAQRAAAMQEVAQQQVSARQAVAETNLERGRRFLAENAKKEGVKQTTSGLQYRVIKAGTGPQPTQESTVLAHYRGTLIDGTEFDSSFRRGEPATFPVGGVIQGWQEALKLMKEGARWEIVVPADLGYGAAGAGNAIGPNEALVFEIELIKVQ